MFMIVAKITDNQLEESLIYDFLFSIAIQNSYLRILDRLVTYHRA